MIDTGTYMPTIPNVGEFLDDHEEQHAVGTGIGIGSLIAASGDAKIAGAVLTVLVRAIRKKRPSPADGQDLLNDIRREPQYFAGGIAIGIALGTVYRVSL